MEKSNQENEINNQTDKTDKNYYIKLFSKICSCILVITIVYFFAVNYLSPECCRNEARGTFGDLFGGLNAIFSGFAFSGVVITILMQMEVLKFAKIELEKSVAAQDSSQQALMHQLKIMQTSTRIESVKSIVDTYDKQKETDKREIAKSVLERIIEKILFEDEFIELVTPKFERKNNSPKIKGKQRKTNISPIDFEKYDTNKQNNIEIDFINIGVSFKIVPKILSTTKNDLRINFSLLSNYSNVRKYQVLTNKDTIGRDAEFRMKIDGITDEKDISIEFDIEGDFVNHKFIRQMHISIENGGNLSIDLESIQRQRLDIGC